MAPNHHTADRILVVDDDRTTRHVTRTLLAKAGFTVRVAKDGAEAIERLRASRFDLMLLDVWMPRMDGLAVLDKIKRIKQRPKVIVLTSDDTPETLLRAIRQRANQIARKPIEPMALLSLVREAITSGPELPIDVISARANWVELAVPCTRAAAISHPDDPIEHMNVREQLGLRPGGFGILTVKGSVDELIYNEKQNEVVFVKYLD